MRDSAIEVGTPDPAEYGRIGELVYLVDPYIYPALFGTPEVAKRAMPALMGMANSPFAPEFFSVARIGGSIAGILVLYAGPFEALPVLSDFYGSELPLPESSRDVCERYLLPMCQHVDADEAYIPCIATSPEFRGRGVASALIRDAFGRAGGRPLALDVLKDNANAIRLYERHGFKAVGEAAGYAYSGEPPEVVAMRTG